MSGWLIVIGTIVINGALGVVVGARNSRALLNRLFLILILALTLWAVSSAVSDSTSNLQLARYASYAAFGTGLIGVFCAYLFSVAFRHHRLKSKHYTMAAAVAVASAVSSTPLVYELKTMDEFQNGVLYIPYLILLAFILVMTVRNFVAVVKKGNALERNHARLMLIGTVATIVLASITNAIIPMISQVSWTTKYGPLFTVIFTVSVAYSIIRHRLFDVRAIAARSLAYVLAMTTILVIYAVFVFGLIENVFAVTATSSATKALYTVSAILLAVTFTPIRKFFNKITDGIFYRDDYRTDVVLDELNETIVESVKLSKLADGALSVLHEAMKPEFISVELTKPNGKTYRQFHIGNHNHNVAPAIEEAMQDKMQTILTDELNTPGTKHLHKKFYKANIAAAIALETSHKTIGYLVFGYRQNGSAYNKKDVRLMTVAADELALAVQNALRLEEIREFNETLQTRIDKATAELRNSNTKLRTLDEAKDEFISMASHQLRTPLTSVKGYLSMVLEGDAGDITPLQRKLLEEAYTSSQRMVYLIGDFLNISRLQTGKFVIERTDTNLADMIQDEIDQLKATAAAHQLKLRYDKPDNFPLLALDENKIRQVVMNYLDNAIFYSKPGTTIDLILSKTAHDVVFKVKDTGIGVPPQEQLHLFTKFYRASNAKRARPDGTGIGLFMAKKAIIAHKGAIIFDSKEGKGSTFGFRLPLETAHVNTAKKQPALLRR